MWTDRQTDMTKLEVTFGNFANTPKNSWHYSTTHLKHVTFFHSFTIKKFLFCVFMGYKIIHYLVKKLGFQQNIYQLQTSLGKKKVLHTGNKATIYLFFIFECLSA